MQQHHTKFGTHHHMLVLLILIEENVKGTISLDSLACKIFLLFYLFSSSRWCESFYNTNNNNTRSYTKIGTHHQMLVLLVFIQENAKGIISLDSLDCEIFLLD